MAFRVGNIVFPIPSATTNPSILRAADPALAKVLDFFSFMITTYVGDALVSYAEMAKAPISEAVAQVAPINPDIIAKAEQWQWPGLFGWRESSKDADKSLNWRSAVATIKLAYILPPLSPSQRVMLEPILSAVGKVCNYAFAQGSDPGYNSGEIVLDANFISRIRLMSEEFGTFKFDDAKENYFPSWLGELELTEQTEPHTVGISDLDGIDTIATHQGDDGYTLFVTGTLPAPAVTLTGDLPLPPELRVEIQTTGVRGVATFRISLNAGSTYIASGVVTSATYTIPGTAFVLNFPTGTYTNNNVYVSVAVAIVRAQTDF